ncbi:MAG: hypothetical protein HC840_02560 [Leptolyngbyaceae cyanobacterium RM2_2_4]|nr:hypothetical protein [Leptolyngbyaceae cyanobacterium RM2_2_4]
MLKSSFRGSKRSAPLRRQTVYWIAAILAALLVEAILLTLPIPAEIGLAMRYNPLVPLVAMPLLLYPIYRRSESLAICLGFLPDASFVYPAFVRTVEQRHQ